MSDHMECLHCGNRVEEIKYKDKQITSPGTLTNKFKHVPPYDSVVCGINPLTDDDVQWTTDDEG